MATSSTSSTQALLAPPTFAGVSKFASSLQQVLTRAVGIASLPLDQDQANVSSLNTTQSDLQGLDTVFTALQQSVSSLQSTLTSSLLSASVSNSNVSATVGTGATAGTYTISVGTLGTYSTALSIAGATPVTDPTSEGISTSTTFNLTIGANPAITITPASSDLQDLASAVNSQSNGQVQATVVNVGSTSSPDYRLSLQAANLGTDAIDLTDSSNTDLTPTATTGLPATYQIDGSPSIPSSSRTVTLSTGLTLNLLAQSASGTSTTVTVADSPAGLASAFSSFAGSYNAAVDALAQYHGQGGGALEGNSIVQTLTSALNQLGNYSSGSPATALANYGITLGETGQLDVDTTAFTNAANANFPDLLTALGSATGGGFIGTATTLLTGIEDPTAGSLKVEEASVTGEITAAQTTVANEQATVNLLQTNLTQQVAQADTAIAELESQVSYVTGLFAQYTGAINSSSNGLSTL